MYVKSFVGKAALVAVTGFAASVTTAQTIFGGPAYDSTTGTGYTDPSVGTDSNSPVGNGVAVGFASKNTAGYFYGYRAVRWDATGAAASELGNLGTDQTGTANTYAYAVSANGTAVGTAQKYLAGTYVGARAVLWDASGIAVTELGNIGADNSGVTFGTAYAINTAGTVAGRVGKYVAGMNVGTRAARWDAPGTAATELGSIGADAAGTTFCAAYAINEAGTAVGQAQKYAANTLLGLRAVRWDAFGTTATELDNLGTSSTGFTYATAYAINPAGTAIGYSRKYMAGTNVGDRAVRWDASGSAATELGNLGTLSNGFTLSYAIAINSKGTCVGHANKFIAGTDVGQRAVRWDASGSAATELGNLGTNSSGYTWSYSAGINAAGIIVGGSNRYDAGTFVGARAVYWGLDGVAIDLNTLLLPTDAAMWTLTSAAGISDTNWVTGLGTFDPDGPGGQPAYTRAFLMHIPSPCYVNCDASTTPPLLSASDFICFLSKFRAGESYANCDGSTGSPTLTAADFVCFLNAFRAGCP